MRRTLSLLVSVLMFGCSARQQAPVPPPPQPTVKPIVQAAPEKKKPVYPPTEKQDIAENMFGEVVHDPYRWLEDEKAEPVQRWMAEQDAFARGELAKLPGRDALAKRFKELFYVESVQAPLKRGGRFFFMRTHADREKAILYWKQGEKGAEKVLLDPNGWSADGTVSLGGWSVSWDGKKVAYQVKPNAADEATLQVIDVDSGAVSKVDSIEGAKYASASWTPDSKGFYYEWLPVDPKIPVAERPGYTEIRFHKLGTDPKTDKVIHERTNNPSSFLNVSLPRSGKYLFVSIDRGWSENDLYFRGIKEKAFRPLVLGKDARYSVTEWKDVFYVQTNEGASNERIFKVSPKNPDRKNWKEVVPEDKDATLQGFGIVGGHLVLAYLKAAHSELRVATLDGKPVRTVPLPTIGTVNTLRGNEDEDDAYFDFSSYTVPLQVYRTSVKSGAVDLWAKVSLPLDTAPYEVEQVRYPSKDDTQISMFLVHKKNLPKDGSHPVLLYGYGGFNISLTPAFRASIYPWLEAGGIYAVANLRGGGEYGKAWHDAGRGHNKQNVFDDFVYAGEYLVKAGYTKPGKIAIHGGSNGGLLVGAAMTQRPDLWGAVICAVPLLDMVRYDQFGSGKTWVPEYGTAQNAEDFKVIYGYSPYHHVKPGTAYPPLLMMGSDHDDRVDPMHARKFVAAVQNASSSLAPAWLRIEKNAGHGGGDQVKKAIDSQADLWAFATAQLGVKAPADAAPKPLEVAPAK